MVEKVTSPRTYGLVTVVLLALTAATVGVTFLPLGPWHIGVSVLIAVAKASLVALFFMHARYSGPLTRLVIVVAIVWLAILILGTMDDYLTRSWLSTAGH